MKKTILILLAFISLLTACNKDNLDDNGTLLGEWQVQSSMAYEYDLDGNLINTFVGEDFSFRYIDYDVDGHPWYYIFSVANGDKWVFVNDTTLHINDKVFAYNQTDIDCNPCIIIDFPYIEYRIVTLSRKKLELQYIEYGTFTNTKTQEIKFKKL